MGDRLGLGSGHTLHQCKQSSATPAWGPNLYGVSGARKVDSVLVFESLETNRTLLDLPAGPTHKLGTSDLGVNHPDGSMNEAPWELGQGAGNPAMELLQKSKVLRGVALERGQEGCWCGEREGPACHVPGSLVRGMWPPGGRQDRKTGHRDRCPWFPLERGPCKYRRRVPTASIGGR